VGQDTSALPDVTRFACIATRPSAAPIFFHEELRDITQNDPKKITLTMALDLSSDVTPFSVRKERPVVSLLHPCDQPERLSNRVRF
jgi:hypothetical protein